jgi:sterol desaturase/sphingolipid hydroxylase (fatty acid hydroxylase superfamily)
MVLFIGYLEHRLPGHAVDRRWELSLNILALLVVIVAGEMWKTILLTGFNAFDFQSFFYQPRLRELPAELKIFLGVVLADFCLYWVHRFMHRKALLWRTHVFHHSIKELWWLSGSRTSLMHLLLFALPQILLGYYVLGFTEDEAGVAFSVGVVVNVWIHTNLWINLGPLEWILITPNYHRIHHGARGLAGKNLGFVFTIWDRMFGTYADPESVGKGFALGFVSTSNRLLRMMVGV